MDFFSTAGRNLMLQAEGNQRLASALADGVRGLARHFARLFGAARRDIHGKHPHLR